MGPSGKVVPDVEMGWGFFSYTIEGNGWLSGALYEEELLAGGAVEGDVYAYLVPGSEDFAFFGDPAGEPFKIREGEEMGLGALVDIDTYLPSEMLSSEYSEDEQQELGNGESAFFFTLKETAAGGYDNIPASWNQYGSSGHKNGATIFKAKLETNGTWTISVEALYEDLYLTKHDVIDALSVQDPNFYGSSGGANGIRYLVSLDTTDDEMQIWVVGAWVDHLGATVDKGAPLHADSGGYFFNDALQLKTGSNITGACGSDPGDDLGSLASRRHPLANERFAMAFATHTSNGLIDTSVHQVKQVVNTHREYRATLTGFLGTTDTYAQLFAEYAGGRRVLCGYVLRNRRDPDGDKRSLRFSLPIGNPAGSPEPVGFQWEIRSYNSQTIGHSRPMQMLVR